MKGHIITMDGLEGIVKKCEEKKRAPTKEELSLAIDYVHRLEKIADDPKRIREAQWRLGQLYYMKEHFKEEEQDGEGKR